MATVEVTVDVSSAQKALATIGGAFQQKAYLELIGQRFLAWVNENFRRHGAEAPWKPLSPNTIAGRRKGKGAGSAQPLRDRGQMAQSFGPGQPDSLYQIGPDFVVVGSAERKALWHHLGTDPYTIKPKNPGGRLKFVLAGEGTVYRRTVHHPGIPARPLLPSQRLAEELAHTVFQSFVDELTRGLQ